MLLLLYIGRFDIELHRIAILRGEPGLGLQYVRLGNLIGMLGMRFGLTGSSLYLYIFRRNSLRLIRIFGTTFSINEGMFLEEASSELPTTRNADIGITER